MGHAWLKAEDPFDLLSFPRFPPLPIFGILTASLDGANQPGLRTTRWAAKIPGYYESRPLSGFTSRPATNSGRDRPERRWVALSPPGIEARVNYLTVIGA